MDHLSEENYKPNPVLEKALDVLFLIHADHELNASCTTVLQTASSLVDPYSAIAYVPSSTSSSSHLIDRAELPASFTEPVAPHYSKCGLLGSYREAQTWGF